jgi:hypothetical protein
MFSLSNKNPRDERYEFTLKEDPPMPKPTLKSKEKQPQFRTTRCLATKGLTKWCFAVCEPKRGIGHCGRVAPHALRGRTQLAIARYNARQRDDAANDSAAGDSASGDSAG